MADRLHGALRRANGLVALVLGAALLIMAGYVLADVVTRKLGLGIVQGSEEMSGYLMAALASWGLAYTMVERAHVRIDLIRQRLVSDHQALMDLFVMVVTNAVVLLIAFECWPVLATTLKRGSEANTPLSTPLWIPQGIWFAGWLWFALTATALSVIGIAHLAANRRMAIIGVIGAASEMELEQ